MEEKKSDFDEVLRLIDLAIHRKGWNRTDLVKALKKTDPWLSKIMGKTRGLSVQYLLDIAKALDVNPASLLPGENPEFKLDFEEYIKQLIRDEFERLSKLKKEG